MIESGLFTVLIPALSLGVVYAVLYVARLFKKDWWRDDDDES